MNFFNNNNESEKNMMSNLEKRKAEVRLALEALGVCPAAFSRLGLRAVLMVEGVDEVADLMKEDVMFVLGQCGTGYLLAEFEKAEVDEEGGEG